MSETNSHLNQPRLLSFTLDDWNVLGGQVSVSLQNGVVVLVGRNGAGKSAILEGFNAISSIATGGIGRVRPSDEDSVPKILKVEVLTPDDRRLEYKYEFITLATSIDETDIDDFVSDNSDGNQFSWNDRCQYLDGEKELLWTTEHESTTFYSKNELSPVGKLNNLNYPIFSLPIIEVQWVRTVLNGVRLLGKNPVRPSSRRTPSLLKVSSRGVYSGRGLADRLARKILRLMKTDELYELEGICQRVGLGGKIVEKKFVQNGESQEGYKNEEYISSILLDGVNIGLLSDGTLRILAILIELINLNSSTTIIIEEPETQIHPGMLAKLLNEIEAYTFDKNLILSTHSPQVVAWTSPENINLVHRKDGRTFVRKLDEDEIHNVIEYISDEGDLGEWIYSGIVDE